MKSIQLIAISLIVLGALALAYSGFNYSRETRESNPGLVSLPMNDSAQMNVTVWAGTGGVLIGGLLFVFGRSLH